MTRKENAEWVNDKQDSIGLETGHDSIEIPTSDSQPSSGLISWPRELEKATLNDIIIMIDAGAAIIIPSRITTQSLGNILEAKPLCQGQKTRILGRELLSLI